MDHDDEDDSPLISSPNQFLLSIYKENSVNFKTLPSYKCRLCRRIRDNPILVCSDCVNTGQFCSSDHDKCSRKQREMLVNLLNPSDYEEFRPYISDRSTHIQCTDRMFFLKKFNLEKKRLQSELQTRTKLSDKIHKISTDIQVRKNRFPLVHHTIKRLREQIEQKRQINMKTQQRITDIRSHVEIMKIELDEINKGRQLVNEQNVEKSRYLRKHERKLNGIRCERFDELFQYIFPIEQVNAIEGNHVIIIEDLDNAQQTTTDEINSEQVTVNKTASVVEYKHRIVNSCLASDGNYEVANFVLTSDINPTSKEDDRLQDSVSYDTLEKLSALSHACQLINVIAFYLHLHLPFRLHQLAFNTHDLTIDCLRANIAKLNANIISGCLSQDIPMNVNYTLENLLKLLRLKQYRNRQRPVMYSQDYIDTIKKEVNEISPVDVTDYWFFDDDDTKNDEADLLNTHEWEAVPENYHIPMDPSVSDTSDSSPSTSSQDHSSIMTNSIEYLKNRSSVIFDSFRRNFKS